MRGKKIKEKFIVIGFLRDDYRCRHSRVSSNYIQLSMLTQADKHTNKNTTISFTLSLINKFTEKIFFVDDDEKEKEEEKTSIFGSKRKMLKMSIIISNWTIRK